MKKLAVIALAGGMAFAAAPAYKAATNLGWYVGVGINNYTGITEDATVHTGVVSDEYELDSTNIGWDLFAGYRNTQHFGTELGVYGLGNIQYKDKSESDKATHKNMWDVYYDANLYMPLVAGLEVFAKGGVDYFTGKIHYDDAAVLEKKLSTFGLNFGGGLQYMYQQFGIRATYTDLQTLTRAQKDHFNVPNLLGLDVFYMFA